MDIPSRQQEQRVGHFRQILLWPLQLMPLAAGGPLQQHHQVLAQESASQPWRELADEFGGDPEQFQERHYSEFVTFLPYVQRFLYGEGGGDDDNPQQGGSPIRVFRRHDVAQVRMSFKDSETPLCFDIVHLDLYFFHDIDVVILVVEIAADDLDLRTGTGHALPFRPRLSAVLGRRWQRWPLPATQRMARRRRPGPGHLGLREAQQVPGFRQPLPCPMHLVALGVPAAAAGSAPLGRGGSGALPADRVSPHAAARLSGDGRSAPPRSR
jgi:hypothetical protein